MVHTPRREGNAQGLAVIPALTLGNLAHCARHHVFAPPPPKPGASFAVTCSMCDQAAWADLVTFNDARRECEAQGLPGKTFVYICLLCMYFHVNTEEVRAVRAQQQDPGRAMERWAQENTAFQDARRRRAGIKYRAITERLDRISLTGNITMPEYVADAIRELREQLTNGE